MRKPTAPGPGPSRPSSKVQRRGRPPVPLCLASVLLLTVGCGVDEEPPNGTVQLTVMGLRPEHRIQAAAVEPSPIIDVSKRQQIRIEFGEVGNGFYTRSAPPTTYRIACGQPGPDGADWYDPGHEPVQEARLESGRTAAFTCEYIERARVRFDVTGLDSSIPADWTIVAIRRENDGHVQEIAREHAAGPHFLRPENYTLDCVSVIGNANTSRFVLARQTPAAGKTPLGPGQELNVECLYEEDP